jgi:flavin reductase (DIM6/NTAB) family NADH-FMN oxidoreductase RutF
MTGGEQNGTVTGDNPFVPPIDERDPVRRFRGRLAAPVTIVTAGEGAHRAGLTVSSLFVIEGEPGRIHMAVGPLTELWDVLADTGRCVVHIARPEHRHVADAFAGLRPSPGGPFAAAESSASEWGPILGAMPDRASCRVTSMSELGWSGVVETEIAHLELSDRPDSLIHHRGRYRRMGDQV